MLMSFSRRTLRQKKLVGQNSFVSTTFGIRVSNGLVFINDLEDQKFKVGIIMIGVFDKFMHVVAIKGKKEEDLASGMIECLHKMGKNLRSFIRMMKVLSLSHSNILKGTENRAPQDKGTCKLQ